MVGTAQLPKFEDDAYRTTTTSSWFPPPRCRVTNRLPRGDPGRRGTLPSAMSPTPPAGRREAGAAAGQGHPAATSGSTSSTRSRWSGFTRPETSLRRAGVADTSAESLLERLGIHHRVLSMCTPVDMGFASGRSTTSRPGRRGCQRWLEVSSCSVFGTSRRAGPTSATGPRRASGPDSSTRWNGRPAWPFPVSSTRFSRPISRRRTERRHP